MELPQLPNLQAQAAGHMTEEIELIWQASVSSIAMNNNELLLPLDIEKSIGAHGIAYLKHRLSLYLSPNLSPVQVLVFNDQERSCIRMMQVPDFTGSVKTSVAPGVLKASVKGYKQRAAVKKNKVPRPPNAFILFRASRHPKLKDQYPDLHNNDISIILGEEWKNATEEVKNHFRALAVEHKAKHAAAHPDYQYAPRKPSEKKHRMSAKKIYQQIQDKLAIPGERVPLSMFEEMTEAPDYNRDPLDPTPYVEFGGVPNIAPLNDGSVEFTLPDSDVNLQAELETYDTSVVGTETGPTTSIPKHIQNDQDFFDSMIDWKGVVGDLDFVEAYASPNGNCSMKIGVNGDPNGSLLIGSAENRTIFQREMHRMSSIL